jgi:hypothetical protein
MTIHFIGGIQGSFAALGMTGVPASAHDADPDNIVILSAAKDLSSSIETMCDSPGSGVPASAHDASPDNIVILSAAKDLSSSVGDGR